ncbi:MAG TPA: Gfo/Idh/MocA family oxidoreductase, partial [Candidatus Hydrogenedentes bacterium]|nr:Gfo/Idh/MocA family oxidoreductase [Candidatus Hydrogenedentota bacterium]
MSIRTAILGYGRSGSSMHASAIEANAPFEMVAVCDIDPKRREEAAGRFGCATYDAYHAMLDREELDLVCVVTRSDQHCVMTCDCLEAGVDVLVTKPWALNEAEARRMIDTARATGKRLLPWLPARWGSDLLRLKELMAERAIGNVFLVRRSVHSFGTRNDWQTERRCGGGYLLNWGPHIIDPPVLLMGSRVESVYARMKQTINPGDVEDVFFAVLNLADGTLVQAEFTISAEPTPSWFIQGDRGTIVVRGTQVAIHHSTPPKPDDPTQHATMAAGEDGVVDETVGEDLYGDEKAIYARIADTLQGGDGYTVKPAEALELTRVLDAIRTSA